jgi:hypothetical protein
MDSGERQLQVAFGNSEVGTRYYILIKNIVEELIKSADDQRVRKRLSIRAIVDPITDFVDQDPDINGGKIKSILDSDYSTPFITDFCMHLSSGPIKKKSEINDDFQIIVSHYLLLVAPPAPPAPAPPAPAPPAPAPLAPAPHQQDAGPAECVAVFNNEFKGGKRRSIKKRRKSMSKRRKNRRKSNKKQRRR